MTRPDLSRRQFLAHSTRIAGASLGLRATRLEARGSAAGPARLGFLGLGDRGRHLLSVATRLPDARIVALCDPDPGRLKRALDVCEEGRPRGFTRADRLLEDPDVDAVVVATPVDLHASQTIAALEAGKHVYCEKPMGLSAAECDEVLAACRRGEAGGLIYQTGFQRRYNPRYRAGIEFLRGPDVGAIRFVRAQWHAVGSARKDKPWIHRRERSGDAILEQACHQFDIFHWLFGTLPVAATGAGSRQQTADGPPGRNVLDQYAVCLEYADGAQAQLTHLSQSVPERRFAGIYELVFCDSVGVDLANALAWGPDGATRQLLRGGGGNDTRLAVAGFVDSLVQGRRPEADADVAYRASMTALVARLAIDTGRRVTPSDLASSG